jgi:hypothetical protein
VGISFFQKLGVQGHLSPVLTMFECFPRFFCGAVERDASGQFVGAATLVKQIV